MRALGLVCSIGALHCRSCALALLPELQHSSILDMRFPAHIYMHPGCLSLYGPRTAVHVAGRWGPPLGPCYRHNLASFAHTAVSGQVVSDICVVFRVVHVRHCAVAGPGCLCSPPLSVTVSLFHGWCGAHHFALCCWWRARVDSLQRFTGFQPAQLLRVLWRRRLLPWLQLGYGCLFALQAVF